MHLVMRYLCFFGIVKRQGVKRRMDKRSTSEEQKSGYLGLTRADEERHLADVISVAQQNLERAGADIRKVNEDLADLLETYDVKDKEGLALWNNATARLKENEYDLIRYEKARNKPYFGRIDFKDGISQEEETCYIGRAGIAKNGSEPVVLDWRAPIASVYYESSMGPCTYTVSSEGTYEMDLVRKRTYEIEQDVLKDFFDSDVVANDELLTKYLAKNKKAVLGEIIATIQKEQNVIIRRSPRTNVIIQGVAGSGKTTVAMHRISYILYNYKDDFRPEDFYIVGSNRILLNYITSVLPELDVYGIRQLTMEQLFVRLLYEDWDKKERIKAKGMLDTDFLDVTLNARYISFGGKKHRMPLVLSNRGYGIAAAAKNTVLLCDIKTYGQYLYAEGERQLDYYFICGEKPENIITRYKGL